MEHSPDITIVIPNYNGQQFLNQAIDSALSQNDILVEVIVVDDGSTDDSRQILENYKNRIKVYFQSNKGAPAARNLGWKNATSNFIKFLDSDDILLPNALKSQLKIIHSLQHNQIPFGDIQYIDSSNQITDNSFKLRDIKSGETLLEHLLQNNPLTSSPLHRKPLLEAINGFDEYLIKGQEWDLHLRLMLNGCEFKYHKDFVYQFRNTDNESRHSNISLSKNGPLYFLDVFNNQYERIKLHSPDLTSLEKELIAKRYWAYGRGILREGYGKEAKEYFIKAKNIAGNNSIEGSLIYKSLTLMFNPLFTERIMQLLK